MITINAKDFGAKGNGVADDWSALQSAVALAIASDGTLYVPAGDYRITRPLGALCGKARISVAGDSAKVSTIVADGCTGLDLAFDQDGLSQTAGVDLRDLSFRAKGRAGTGIRVSYGNPKLTNEHSRPTVSLRGVAVESGDDGAWDNGIDIESAWGVMLDDVYVSGDSCGGEWARLRGDGIRLRRMCVNAHMSNVRSNFWATGLRVNGAEDDQNTEGVFCNNCSMVAVKRGLWVSGNAGITAAPRISTLTWTGGLIECRVTGVSTGSAAFHLENVWTALIQGCQMIAEALPPHTTYGVFIDRCAGVVISACDINAWHIGVLTTGECSAVNVNGNTYTNVPTQVMFTDGTTRSRSGGAVLFNNEPNEFDLPGCNKVGLA